jgi:hypothetical protein
VSRIDYFGEIMKSTVVVALGVLLTAGCSKHGTGPDAPVFDAPDVPGNPGDPGLGGHGLHYYRLNATQAASIATPPVTTQPRGSTIIVSVGRGNNTLFALPTDSNGNAPYQQLGTMHAYTKWQTSGTALYGFPAATGGPGFQVSTTTRDGDEVTVAAVEVVDATRIQDFQWNEVVQPAVPIAVTSRSVTTTGPATLVAFWWGDGFPRTPQSASASNGFVVIDTNAQETDSFVQCAVAVKNVAQAGTYDVTWTSDPVQGAQLWLVAVQ